jgi:hypothetical protein
MPTRKIMTDTSGSEFTYPWHYRSVIGKLNFLEKSTYPDISFIVHQFARYFTKQRKSHGQAMKHLGGYLLGTKDKGLILQPKGPTNLQCYVDADFAGDGNNKESISDPETAKLQTDFIVLLAEAPLYWQSKMQTIIALSTAESELIALSEAKRFVRSITYIIDKLQSRGLLTNSKPKFHCKVFKDNAAASKSPKIRPRPYTTFANERITVKPIKTNENIADVFTKQQSSLTYAKCRSINMFFFGHTDNLYFPNVSDNNTLFRTFGVIYLRKCMPHQHIRRFDKSSQNRRISDRLNLVSSLNYIITIS